MSGVEGTRRLVQQKNRRILGEGLRYRDTLGLAAGEGRHGAIFKTSQFEFGEEVARKPDIVFAQRPEEGGRMREAPHGNGLEHGKGGVKTAALRQQRHGFSQSLPRIALYGLAANVHASSFGRK